jgi:FlaA1/EpsC-like NDP-sugar epimerase
MKRYFMSIPEAVILVLQAAASGTGGEIFLLDMGEPVRILTVAEEMIRLHGLAPDKDIPIIFTGMRPGEKLYEDLMTPLEKSEQTAHPKIFKAINDTIKTDIIKQVALLEKAAVEGDKPRIIAILKEIIPAYNPQLHP